MTAEDRDDPNTVNTKVFYEIKEVVKADNEISNLAEDCPILFKVKTLKQKHAEISTNCHLKGYYGIWALTLFVSLYNYYNQFSVSNDYFIEKTFLQVSDLGVDPGPLNQTKIYNISIIDYNYNSPEIVYPITGKSIRLSRVNIC